MLAIPWWMKLGAKIALSRLPFGYSVWQRLGLFRHGEMDSPLYAIRVFDDHVARIGCGAELRGKTILELGPGDSIATALIAKAHGARAILVDVGSYVRHDVAPYMRLAVSLVNMGLRLPDLADCNSIEEILSRCDAEYLTGGLDSLRAIESASVDVIFSQAVLEHVRKHEFLETMNECRRVIRRGGRCSHQVDLRDHFNGALNNLRFSEKTWESEPFVSAGFYTNRLRFSDIAGSIEMAGFEIQHIDIRRWRNLPTDRHKLAPEFRNVADEELLISDFDIVLRCVG